MGRNPTRRCDPHFSCRFRQRASRISIAGSRANRERMFADTRTGPGSAELYRDERNLPDEVRVALILDEPDGLDQEARRRPT
jgi:hypothetical protein